MITQKIWWIQTRKTMPLINFCVARFFTNIQRRLLIFLNSNSLGYRTETDRHFNKYEHISPKWGITAAGDVSELDDSVTSIFFKLSSTFPLLKGQKNAIEIFVSLKIPNTNMYNRTIRTGKLVSHLKTRVKNFKKRSSFLSLGQYFRERKFCEQKISQ